jgi:lysophospholipase II
MGHLKPYVVGPAEGVAHTHTVILLHGRSSTAAEFATDFLSLKGTSHSLHCIFPSIRWEWQGLTEAYDSLR